MFTYNARSRSSENLTAVADPEADRETDIQAHTPQNKCNCVVVSILLYSTLIFNLIENKKITAVS